MQEEHKCTGCKNCGGGKKTVADIVADFSGGTGVLIPVLQKVQDEYGYISRENVAEIGKLLGIPASEIYGVFSFYSQFRDVPPAKNTVEVCMGTACYVLGAGEVLDEFCNIIGIKSGETSQDGMWKITGPRCLGCCGLAPVVSINGKIYGHVTRKEVAGLVEQYKGGAL